MSLLSPPLTPDRRVRQALSKGPVDTQSQSFLLNLRPLFSTTSDSLSYTSSVIHFFATRTTSRGVPKDTDLVPPHWTPIPPRLRPRPSVFRNIRHHFSSRSKSTYKNLCVHISFGSTRNFKVVGFLGQSLRRIRRDVSKSYSDFTDQKSTSLPRLDVGVPGVPRHRTPDRRLLSSFEKFNNDLPDTSCPKRSRRRSLRTGC